MRQVYSSWMRWSTTTITTAAAAFCTRTRVIKWRTEGYHNYFVFDPLLWRRCVVCFHGWWCFLSLFCWNIMKITNTKKKTTSSPSTSTTYLENTRITPTHCCHIVDLIKFQLLKETPTKKDMSHRMVTTTTRRRCGNIMTKN